MRTHKFVNEMELPAVNYVCFKTFIAEVCEYLRQLIQQCLKD